MFRFPFRRRALDEVRATVVAVDADGGVWAKPFLSRDALVPIRRHPARRLGLLFGTLVDIGIDPDTLRPRRVTRVFDAPISLRPPTLVGRPISWRRSFRRRARD
jgi:hypothetical protein